MLIIGFMSGSFMGQQMQFLELMPKFKCWDSEPFLPYRSFDCYPLAKKGDSTPHFCNNDAILKHEIDWSNPLSIHNWMVDL